MSRRAERLVSIMKSKPFRSYVNRFTRTSFSNDSNEQGVVLVLFAVLLTGIFGVATLVVDLGREEISARQTRNAADAAALAGARYLDGSTEGYRSAKRAALGTLRITGLYGAKVRGLPDNFVLNEGDTDTYESPTSRYSGSQGSIQNVSITIVNFNIFW